MMNAHTDFADDIAVGGKPKRSSAIWKKVHQHRWFMLFVVLPVFVSAIYYGFIASDQYVSESRFVVKSPGQRGGQVSTLASLVQTTGLSAGQEQTNEVLGYLRSRNALEDLQRRVNTREIFSHPSADRLSRFPSIGVDASKFENLYKFYEGKVKVRIDSDTGLAILEVRAFDPADAYRINTGLLDLSETLVNRLNERSRQKGIDEAERRVGQAEARVRAARVSLGAYRQQQSLIDPKAQSEGIFQIVTQLTSQRAALQAQLDQLTRITPANPAIPSLRGRINGISREINAQSGRIVGNSGAIAAKIGPYEGLASEQEFASQNFTVASAALEQARVDAQKQQFYLERVVEPNQPDTALYPKRLVSIATIAGAALCLYLIGWMLVVGILEHAPED